MAERSFGTANLLLGWALGIFALISGIQEVAVLNSGSSFALIIAVGKIVVGVILIAAPLRILHDGVARALVVIAVLFWIALAVLELFFWSHPFQPEVLPWLKNLAWYLILIIGSWQVRNSLP